MLNDSVLISKNIQLTYKLTAIEIYISRSGDITLIVSQIGPYAPCPKLSVDYLEALCCSFYFGGHPRRYAIADILLLNGLLRKYEYSDFYRKRGRLFY